MSLIQIGSSERVVVLDLETSGLSPKLGHKIIEVAAIELNGDEFGRSFQSLINPQIRLDSRITKLTGITDKMLEAAPPPPIVLRNLCDFIGSSKIVLHNAPFDNRFIKAEFAAVGLACRYDMLCTLKLSREIVPGLGSYRLEKLAEHFGIARPDQYHRAMADTIVTAHLFMRLKQMSETASVPRPSTQQPTADRSRPEAEISFDDGTSSSTSSSVNEPTVTFASIAEQVRTLDTKKQFTVNQQNDVLILIDYMRNETVKLLNKTLAREEAVIEREKALAAREHELEVKLKTFKLATRVRETIEARTKDFEQKENGFDSKQNDHHPSSVAPASLLDLLKSGFLGRRER